MGMWKDLSLAVRTWRRTPVAAAVIVLTLALGLGVTTTAFTIAYAVLVRPLPFPNADRLVWISTYNTRTSDGSTAEAGSNRMPQFIDWQQNIRSFAQLAAWAGRSYDIFTITGEGTPERVPGLEMTEQLLPMLGARPVLGRLFREDEDRVGAPPAVILSQRFWQRRYDSRTDVIGEAITVDNVPHTIVGVLSDDFALDRTLIVESPIEVYLPLIRNPKSDLGFFMTVIGRLRGDATPQQALAELKERQSVAAVTARFMTEFAQTVTPLAVPVTRDARTPLLLLLGGVGLVLLMACANLANLLLIRFSGRKREMQLRAALGATSGRILRQTVTESGLLVATGGMLGTVLAFVLTGALRQASWLELPRLPYASIDLAALAFAGTICAVITIAFGCVPFVHVRHRDLMETLRPYGGVTGDRRVARVQLTALVAQTAVALALTVAGVLLFKSFTGLLAVDPGFTPEGAMAMRVDPASRIRPQQRVPFFTQILENVSALPGVRSAAVAINIPLDRNMNWDVEIPGQPFRPGLDVASARIVSSEYFRTVGIPVIEGRDFDVRDQINTPLAVAINETLARRIGGNPLGQTLVVSGRPREVIAIVGDVRHRALKAEAGPEFYVSFAQTPGWQAFDLVVRTVGDPLGMVPAIRDAIWRVDPQQAVGTPIELQQLIDRTVRPQRILSWLLNCFAGAALLLAALGIYGIVSYRVAQRTKETAIRVALGAPRWRIESSAVASTLRYVGIGLVFGVPLAFGAGAAVRSFLFGVAPYDATTLLTASATVVTVAAIAAYFPARRSARVDTISALRAE
jgi:predicted permease